MSITYQLSSTKAKLERVGRNALVGTPLFAPVRSLYQRACDREKWLFWNRMLELYAAYIRPGDIVFDVGANIGTYTEVFSRLGATVVAIEPNSRCCEQIRRSAGKNNRVIVEACAAGATVGSAALHICEESAMCTLSERWLDSVSRSELHKQAKWLDVIEVPVKTLDALAEQYGEPSFVKIDAEGFDDRILEGTSFRPAALSFEFNLNALDVALRCLETSALREGYLFNYTVGHSFHYSCDTWLSREQMASMLENVDFQEEYGDVFARRSI